MSDTQAETLAAISDFIEAHGVPPTIRELGAVLGLAGPSAAHRRVRTLEAAGLIERVGTRKLIVVKERT